MFSVHLLAKNAFKISHIGSHRLPSAFSSYSANSLSKSCHSKNFGNRDLRQANLPHYDITPAPSTSPIRGSATRVSSTNGVATPRMKLSGFWATSPASAFPRADPKVAPLNEAAQGETDAQESQDTMDESSVSPCPISDSPPMNTTQSDVCGRAGFGTPRTISPSPSRRSDTSIRLRHFTNNSVGSISTSSPKMEFSRLAGALPVGRESSVNQCETEREAVRPLLRMSPGTRYGAALGSGVGVQVTGSGLSKKWGAGTPNCPRCGKSVYFAEQVGYSIYNVFPCVINISHDR